MIVDGRVFASTFSGENCNFGQDSVADGWRSQFTQHPDLSGQNAVYFVPSFFSDPSTFGQYDGVMDGDFNVGVPIVTKRVIQLTHVDFYSGTVDGRFPLRPQVQGPSLEILLIWLPTPSKLWLHLWAPSRLTASISTR